jgi:hypothetical protein
VGCINKSDTSKTGANEVPIYYSENV